MNSALLSEEKTILKLRTLYRKYGYLPYKMNRFEEYDLYVKNKNFLISDNIITFTDTSGKLMALKPDVTLSIVKNSQDIKGFVQKVCYNEYVCRPSGAGKSFREIMQTGLECIGDVDAYCRAEVLYLAVQSLNEIAETSLLSVSHLGVIADVLDVMDVSPLVRGKLVECIQEKNLHDAEKICADAGVSSQAFQTLAAIMKASGDPDEVFAVLKNLLPNNSDVKEFETIISLLPKNAVRIDFSLLNDMHYYNGIVFQGFVDGVASAVLSGGEYGPLMEKMGKKSKALGFAVYLDKLVFTNADQYDVDTLILYDSATNSADVAKKVQELQNAGKRVSAQKMIPEMLRYRELIRLTGGN